MSDIAWRRIPKKTLEADRRSSQSEASSAGQVHRTVQSVAFTKKRKGVLLVQSDSSGRTTRQTPRHWHKLLWLIQSEGFGTSFKRTTRQNHRLSQSHPSVVLSSDGLSSDGSSFGQNRRLSQSHPSVGLSSDGLSSDRSSFGRVFGSANHILWSDYLRTDFLRDQSETLKAFFT